MILFCEAKINDEELASVLCYLRINAGRFEISIKYDGGRQAADQQG